MGRGRIASAIRVRGFGLSKGLGLFKSRARRLRTVPTHAETRLWQTLRNRRLAHYKFRRRYPIDRFQRTRALEAFGFQMVRVNNIDVYDNLDGVLEMICDTLENLWVRSPAAPTRVDLSLWER